MSDETLILLRKELHAHPEVSTKEEETSRRIKQFISQFKPDQVIENLGGFGLLFIYDSGNPGTEVLCRCDMDALPIHETNEFKHKSCFDNIAHKCGHDGHMVIMSGLAKSLFQNKLEKGKVFLLFQPAEETGEGALKVLNDSKFKDINPDYVFALHNIPGYSENQIIIKENTFSSSVSSMIIKLEGKTAHASEPEHGINPSFAIAKIIDEFEKLNTNNPKKDDFVVITPIFCQIGSKAYGTAAGKGEVHFTIRTWSQQNMDILKAKLVSIIKSLAKTYLLKYSIDWIQDFQATKNDIEANEIIRNAARLNGFDIFETQEPFKWGEDFGIFTQKYKGAMFGLGAGNDTPALHNPDYDFPDKLIPTGINMFRSIIDQICKK
jgi:amidohydrolase